MNRIIQVIKKTLFDKNWRTLFLSQYGVYNKMEDASFLQMIYKAKMGKALDLNNPQTFNEKMQWLKIHDRKPQYTTMVDKYAVKEYVASLIGEEYIIHTLGVWNSFDEIDFSQLPSRFVLKCTHDSGGIIICKNKDTFDAGNARKRLNFFMKRNYFAQNREWPYKNVPHRILAEQYMEENGILESGDLKDYKIWCFHGVPKMTLVCSERFSSGGLREDFFDMQWKHLPVGRPSHPFSEKAIPCPENYALMKSLAEKLSQDIPFVRVDFYEINGRVYFGEITFFPASGMDPFAPEEWDTILGSWIKLP